MQLNFFSLSLLLINIASDLALFDMAFDRQNESETITSASRRHVGLRAFKGIFCRVNFLLKSIHLKDHNPIRDVFGLCLDMLKPTFRSIARRLSFVCFYFHSPYSIRCGFYYVVTGCGHLRAKKRTSFVTLYIFFFIITFVCMFTVSIRFRNVLLGADILANGLIKRKYYPKLVLCADVTLFFCT